MGAIGLVFGATLLVVGVVLLAQGSHVDLADVQMDSHTVAGRGVHTASPFSRRPHR